MSSELNSGSASLTRLLKGSGGLTTSEPSLHPSMVAAYRLRVVALGTLINAGVAAALIVYLLLGASGEHNSAALIGVVAATLMVLGAVVVLPWAHLLRTRWALWWLYGWSTCTLFVAGGAVFADGGGTTPLYVLFPILTVFFAIVYPLRAQIGLLAMGAGVYTLASALAGWDITASYYFVRIAALGALAYVASVLSGWLVVEMRDRAASSTTAERRKDMLDIVARSARRMGSLDATHVLDGALSAAVELGCLDAEVWIESGESRQLKIFRRVSPDGSKVDAGAINRLFGHARSSGLTQVQELEHGARFAALIHQEREPVGVFVVTTDDVDRNDSLLLECIELLSAQLTAGLDIARNASERKALEERLAHQAFHDALTNLPNRVLFADRLELALARSARDGSSLAVLFLDLDGFKEVNDTLGHGAGDELLKGVAQRVQTCLRPNDTLARYGGDEFVILLEKIESPKAAEQVAERILQALQRPLEIAGKAIAIRTSIGIALTSYRSGADADVVRRADIAMYQSKERGGACYVTSTGPESPSAINDAEG